MDELTRFARAFATEDELIKSIATMLRHRKDVAEVHILDSSHERGKDIVFYADSPLGQRVLHACVIKNKKIAGPVGSPYSPMTVLDQARQALSSPYQTPTGQEHFVAMVHILSPYELPPSSLYAIQNVLKGQALFCCGGQLRSEFRDHWPEFLFDTGSLGIYVNELQNRIDKDDPVSVLYSDHSVFFGQGPALRKTYVKQTFDVTLSTFTLNLIVPSLESLQGRITLDEVTESRTQFRKFAALFTAPHFEEIIGEESGSSVVRETEKMAETIRELWGAAYTLYESEMLRRKEVPRPRKSVGVDIEFNEPTLIKLKSIIDKCDKVAQVLQSLVSESNTFVRKVATKFTNDRLHSKEFLSYCYLQEIANLAPNVIHAHGAREVALKGIALQDLGPVLITAPAGYGKSSFCFHYAKADASALIDKKAKLLPVYVKLHLLASRSLGSYQDEFYGSSELRTLADPTNTESKSRIEKIRIYLDGIDEISRMGRQREVMELAQQAIQDDPRVEIVVTGRDYVHGPWLRFLPRISLSELSDSQVDELVTGLLDDVEQAKRFYKELGKVPSLKPLMRVPLLATLIVSVYRKRTALPENRVKLYDIFLDLMCGGWDIAKNVLRPTAFGAQTKLSVLTRLAGIAHLNKKRDFGKHELRMAIKDTNPALDNHYRELLDEVVQDGVLIRSGSVYAFKHLSFQEYLAAKDIHGPTGRRQQQVLRWYLHGEEWWFQTMAFYVGMLGNPSDTEKWIKSNYVNFDDLSVRTRVDRLLQALKDTFPGYGSKSFGK